MDYPQNLSESDRRWFDLIQECRTSGKSDRQWLAENGIAPPTFYYHVKQLRKKACEIPAGLSNRVSEIQEVVPLVIEDIPSGKPVALSDEPDIRSDNTTIRLTIRGVTVGITNDATQAIIQNTIAALRFLC
ncbi:MAG: IS66 family insertion sequence element accessory protein TnpA [Lachnospiraceae bacterium]